MDPFANWEGNAASRAQAYAASASDEARRAQRENKSLSERVARLEDTVNDLLTVLAEHGIVTIVDPDTKE